MEIPRALEERAGRPRPAVVTLANLVGGMAMNSVGNPVGRGAVAHATTLRMGSDRVGSKLAAAVAAASVAVVLALGLACTSPTLPLPPPALPSISAGLSPDTFRLTSVQGVEPNALVLVVNRSPDVPREKRVSGTIADEQGSYGLDVYARPGDALDVSQETGAVRSPPTTITAR